MLSLNNKDQCCLDYGKGKEVGSRRGWNESQKGGGSCAASDQQRHGHSPALAIDRVARAS